MNFKYLLFPALLLLCGCSKNFTQAETRAFLVKKYETYEVTEFIKPRGSQTDYCYMFILRTKFNTVMQVYAYGDQIREEHILFGYSNDGPKFSSQ